MIALAKFIFDQALAIFGIYRARPRLKVEYRACGGDSGEGSTNDKLQIRWRYQVSITNMTKEDALEFSVLRSNLPQLSNLGIHHIKALETLTIDKEFSKELDRDTVVVAQHNFHGTLEPAELAGISMVLEYKSGFGITFYTDYQRSRKESSNQWPLQEPKNTAEPVASADARFFKEFL